MSFRNLSPQRMFEQMARDHVPQYRFKGKNRADFERWKKAALPRVLKTLGDFPPRVPPQPHFIAEWEHDGLRKQRWLIDVGPHIAAEFLVNYPPGLAAKETRPAILCCHGHGAFGKEPVMGNDTSAELRTAIREHNYNYGHVMAKRGFITFAIDWIGFGERNDNCFRVDTSTACFRRLAAVYQAAGERERLELDFHAGEHGWGDNRSAAFFARHLQRRGSGPAKGAAPTDRA
jgi:hypothetical protein